MEHQRNPWVAPLVLLPGYKTDMTNEKPQLPPRTGNTKHLVERLVQRRKDLGMTQEELAQRWTDYARRQAERFGEPTEGVGVSRAYISRIETMFRDGASEKAKRTRVTMAMNSYAIWMRCLGLRMVREAVDVNADMDAVILPSTEADVVRKLAALPARQRRAVRRIVLDLWGAYDADEEDEPVLRAWSSSK